MSAIEEIKLRCGVSIDSDFPIDKTIKPASVGDETAKFTPNVQLHEFVISHDSEHPIENSHYTLLEVLGKGGMGIVYLAHQHSTDSLVALKLILPEKQDSQKNLASFLAEAVVTANLDHPNILPVHDVGYDQNGTPFYSMKRVTGLSWFSVIDEKTQKENVEILMSVCDAILYAHDQKIIHRDLKPENVMIGNYGEVVVLDWGLAVSFSAKDTGKAELISSGGSFGGTAAYMAPEMAICDSTKLGAASDIYLLGAILYEIVTGLAPHEEEDIYSTILAAQENRIQPTEIKGELIEIALEAMATTPEERFSSVRGLKNAIITCMTHAESIDLESSARKSLNDGYDGGGYTCFAQAHFGFNEAIKQWSGNEQAWSGLKETAVAYAECAFGKNDLDLAESLLDSNDRKHSDLLTQIGKQQTTRRVRHRTIRVLVVASLLLLSTIIIVMIGAFYLVRTEQKNAETEKDNALWAQELAVESERKAKLEGAKAIKLLRAVERERDNTKKALSRLESEKRKVLSAKEESKTAIADLSQEKLRLSNVVAPKYLKEALAHYKKRQWKDASSKLKLAMELNDSLPAAWLLQAKFDLATLKFLKAKESLSKCLSPPKYLVDIIDKYILKTEPLGYKCDVAILLELINELKSHNLNLLKCLLRVRSSRRAMEKWLMYARKALENANPRQKHVGFRYQLLSRGKLAIDLSYNKNLDNIKPLENLPVRNLNLEHTNLSDITPLLNMSDLRYLNLKLTKVSADQFSLLDQLNLKGIIPPYEYMKGYSFLNTFYSDSIISLSFDESSMFNKRLFGSDSTAVAHAAFNGAPDLNVGVHGDAILLKSGDRLNLVTRNRHIIGKGVTISFFFMPYERLDFKVISFKRMLPGNKRTVSLELKYSDFRLKSSNRIDRKWNSAMITIEGKLTKFWIDGVLVNKCSTSRFIRVRDVFQGKKKRRGRLTDNSKNPFHLSLQSSVFEVTRSSMLIDEFSIIPRIVEVDEMREYIDYISRKKLKP